MSNSYSLPFSKRPLVYYLPSFLVLAINVFTFGNVRPDQVLLFVTSRGQEMATSDMAIQIAGIAFLLGNIGFVSFQLIITLLQHFSMLKKIKIGMQAKPSYLPYFQPAWSHLILISVLCFVCLSVVMNLVSPAFIHVSTSLFNVGFLVSGGVAGLLGMKQVRIFKEVDGLEAEKEPLYKGVIDPAETKSNTEEEAINNAIGTKEAKDIIDRLQHHLLFDKPYLNNKIGATELASCLGVSKQKLAHVVNNVMDTNFYGLVNKYRIIEAKELLAKPENQKYNIETISKMVGFNSKSSFNASFKKMPGQTPSGFRKSNKPR